MAQKLATIDSLTKLFDGSSRPIYAVDSRRQIVYCNRAVAKWLDLDRGRIIGRPVEYHSEPMASDEQNRDDAPLAELCPPPRALAGEPCVGTLSCMARGGRLVHRRAEFVPLGDFHDERPHRNKGQQAPPRYAVLVLLAADDMSPHEVAAELSGEPRVDELHRTIRRFRHALAARYSIVSLLGSSPAMQKVRSQVAAAAASGANTLVYGRPGSGRTHVARAIHYSGARDTEARLVPIDCELVTDERLRRAIDALRAPRDVAAGRPTLLLENLERMSASHQSIVLTVIRQNALGARIVATCNAFTPNAAMESETSEAHASTRPEDAKGTSSRNSANPAAGLPVPATTDAALFDAVSIILIYIPPLADRLEDLPLLAQYFLEACNRGSEKQVGSLRADALDMLALYSWPGELEQLREVISAAHRGCKSHEITAGDLPAIVHHASRAAAHVRRQPERIVLDELLAAVEKEAIVRALAQAGGNKSEAAGLLGMTRPRLYRRLVQLGLVAEVADEPQPEQPEFIEGDSSE